MTRSNFLFICLAISTISIRIIISYLGLPLYADGSYVFISILQKFSETHALSLNDEAHLYRIFANLINQLPLNIGLMIGIRDWAILKLLFSLPLTLLPALIPIILCFCKTENKEQDIFRSLSLIVFAVFVLPSEIFSSNTALLAQNIYILFGFLILGRYQSIAVYIFQIILGVILFQAYNSVIIAGPALLLMFYMTFKKTRRKLDLAPGLVVLGACFYNIYSLLSKPPSKDIVKHLEDFSDTLSLKLLFTSVTLLSLGICIGTFLIFKYRNRKSLILLSFSIPPLLLLTLLFFSMTTMNPFYEYSIRTWMIFAALSFYLIIYLIYKNVEVPHESLRKLFLISCFCFSIWQLNNAIYWQKFSTIVTSTIAANTGLIEPPTKEIPLPISRYTWSFAWPSISIVSGEQPIHSIILPSKHREMVHLEDSTLQIPFCTIDLENEFWKIQLNGR